MILLLTFDQVLYSFCNYHHHVFPLLLDEIISRETKGYMQESHVTILFICFNGDDSTFPVGRDGHVPLFWPVKYKEESLGASHFLFN